MEFGKGGRSSHSRGFLSSAAWEAVQVDVARVVDKRYIETVALPYFWISTLRAVQGINWLDQGYAKLSGAEREWLTQVEDTSREALDRLGPVVWDKGQLGRLRDALPGDGPRRASTPAAGGSLLGRLRQRLQRQPRPTPERVARPEVRAAARRPSGSISGPFQDPGPPRLRRCDR